MKNRIKPPNIADICERSNMSAGEVGAFLELLKRSMAPRAFIRLSEEVSV